METIYECDNRTCYNRAHHFHSNQCYTGCSECFPPKKNNSERAKLDLPLVLLLFFAGLSVTATLVGLVLGANATFSSLSGPDGTYQKCRIPAPDTSQGFYCDPIEREEYMPHITNDLVDNPDGSQYWYVSHER